MKKDELFIEKDLTLSINSLKSIIADCKTLNTGNVIHHKESIKNKCNDILSHLNKINKNELKMDFIEHLLSFNSIL